MNNGKVDSPICYLSKYLIILSVPTHSDYDYHTNTFAVIETSREALIGNRFHCQEYLILLSTLRLAVFTSFLLLSHVAIDCYLLSISGSLIFPIVQKW